MGRQIAHGSVDQSTTIRIVDSTDGTPETGVVAATAGLSLWYRRTSGLLVPITPLADLAALNSAHADGGLLHISDGYYRLDVPDAAWARGASDVVIGGGATGMVAIAAEHALFATLLGVTGNGPYVLTITVNDGTDPLEGATVRFTKGGESYASLTNASGVVSLSLTAGTWDVAISLPLYMFTATTKVVSATGSQTYSMTAQSITASEPGQVTGYLYAYDELGAVEAGVVYTLAMIRAATGYGAGPDSKARTATSDALGLVQFTGMFPGATYSIQRGSSPVASFKVPAGTTGNYSIPNVLGQEAA